MREGREEGREEDREGGRREDGEEGSRGAREERRNRVFCLQAPNTVH